MSIREALEAADLAKIKSLVQTAGKDELKSVLISQNIATNNTSAQNGSERLFNKILCSDPEFAFKIVFLFSPNERKEIHPDFSMKDVFTFVERKNNTTTDNKLKSKPSARQLADKIRRIFPEINAAELNCNSLVSLKHYRTALFLGMPFTPEFFLKSLASKSYSSDLLNDLLVWLIRNGFMTKNPFSLQELPFQIVHGNKFIVSTILKEFPQSLADVDQEGNNIFHYCLTLKSKFIFPLLRAIRITLSAEKLVEMLAHRYAAVKLVRIAKEKWRPFPIEIIHAYEVILKRNNGQDIATISQHIHEFHMPTALLLHLYLGIGSESLLQFKDIFPPMKIDANTGEYMFEISTGARDKKKALNGEKKNKNIVSKAISKLLEPVADWSKKYFVQQAERVETPDPDPKPYILNLSEEPLLLIALHLSPVDAFDFLTSCKQLSQCLKSTQNSLIWQSYHKRHFYPCNLMGSFKKKFLVETRGIENWRENKSHKLTVPDIAPSCQPHLMDENWLLLLDNYSAARFWNCHSQRIEFAPNKLDYNWQPQAMLNCYSHNETPPVIFYQIAAQRNYKVMRGENIIDLPNLTGVHQAQPPATYRPFTITSIDHRVILSDDFALYDVAQDRVLHQQPEVMPPSYYNLLHAYNPYNRTLLRAVNNVVNIYDLDLKLLQSITTPTEDTWPRVMQLIDEFTFLFVLGIHRNKTVIYDTRMNEPLLKLDNMFGYGETMVTSPHRLVYTSYKLPLVTSFNLVTREMEWVECSEMAPKCINSRYLVSMDTGHIDIRDYCSNQIRYE